MVNKIVVSVTLLFLGVVYSKEVPIVQTSLGLVSGYNGMSSEGRIYSAFEGIPYAKPPIGELRFEEPKPMDAWGGIWNASYTTQCPQNDIFQKNAISGDEDCLHLNIYIPRKNPDPQENLDVVVHIHGGAFMYCSGHYYTNPKFFMDRDIIFITFNYRLGIFGFLSTEDDAIPGNNGMKDQVLALKWIQDNIASFGGNPKSVTITGSSAGSASVHLHYLSDMSKNLFSKGIAHSGVALNPWVLQEAALQKAKILAEGVGCPTSNTRIIKDCLKQRPSSQIMDKITEFLGYKLLPLAPFAPVVEKGSKPFLKDYPYNLLLKGEINDVPIIFSTTIHEGYLFPIVGSDDLEVYETKWESLASIILDFNYTLASSLHASVAKKIKKFYFGDKPINIDNLNEFVEMFGDRLFYVDLETSVKLQAKAAKSPVYYYSFAYPGEHRLNDYVAHGGDSKYFYGSFMSKVPLTDNEKKMTKLLLDLVTSYAATGTPRIEELDWPPTKNDELTYLSITSFNPKENEIKTVKTLGRSEFWKSLHLQENGNLINIKDEL